MSDFNAAMAWNRVITWKKFRSIIKPHILFFKLSESQTMDDHLVGSIDNDSCNHYNINDDSIISSETELKKVL